MKKTRRIAAMLAALTLAACAVAPSMMFASAEYTVTVGTATDGYDTPTAANHTYEAYQIFKGDVSGAEGSKKLSNVDWGDNITYSADMINEVKAIGDNFSAITYDASNSKKVAQAVADALAKETGNDTAVAKKFADIAGKYKKGTAKGSRSTSISLTDAGYYLIQDTASSPSGTAAVDGTEGSYSLKDSKTIDDVNTALNLTDSDVLTEETILDYLNKNWATASETLGDIVEYTPATEGTAAVPASEAKTRYILAVVGDVTIHPKSSAPTVVKKVKENSDVLDFTYTDASGQKIDNDYNDIADYSIGDTVSFKLYGTLPDKYDDYKQYYYKFTDTIDSYFGTPKSIKVYVDGKEVTGGFTTTATANGLTVEFKNLKATDKDTNTVKDASGNAVTISASSYITVTYDAVLQNTAVIGRDGQRNKVDLTFSNNPNQEYDGTTTPDTSKTPEDGVIVFTYGVDINKVKPDESTKLAGAYFALYTLGADGTTKTYIKTTATGKYDGTVATAPTAATITDSYTGGNGTDGIFKSDGTNLIKIEGLDAGTYYIEELKQPEGYNKLEKDIKVIVKPTIKEERQNWTFGTTSEAAAAALTALEIKYDEADVADNALTKNANATADSGKGTVTIVNKEGNTLPSTGGIGTTLFYLAGGVMVVGAGVVLVTKKRIGKED